METKQATYTPGPLAAQDTRIMTHLRYEIIDADGNWIAGASTMEDAILYSAAPELLDACKSALELITNTNAGDGQVRAELRAAIAKAEGRES